MVAKTAADFLAERQNDPAAQQRQRDHDEHVARSRRAYEDAAAGLLADLADTAVTASTLAELRSSKEKAAVPVLIDWLPRADYLPLKQDIIDTLGQRWTGQEAIDALIAEWDRTDPATDPDSGVRWTIADALSRVVDDRHRDDLVRMARDQDAGTDRTFIVIGLGRMKKSKDTVIPVLLDLLDDPAVTAAAITALGNLKDPAQAPVIERYVNDNDDWTRDQARKALRKLQP
jgi:HEAT repeat protein